MKITIRGLFLASALMTVGCANAIARHDLFERGDIRIERMFETARRTCRGQEPKKALPSAARDERCVLEALWRDDALDFYRAARGPRTGLTVHFGMSVTVPPHCDPSLSTLPVRAHRTRSPPNGKD